MKEEKHVLNLSLDEEQMRGLLDLEKTTHQSVSSLVREGIEMYLRFKKAGAPRPEFESVLFPFVFDRPYRDDHGR